MSCHCQPKTGSDFYHEDHDKELGMKKNLKCECDFEKKRQRSEQDCLFSAQIDQ